MPGAADNAALYGDEVQDALEEADEAVSQARGSASARVRAQQRRVAADALKQAQISLGKMKQEVRAARAHERRELEERLQRYRDHATELRGAIQALEATEAESPPDAWGGGGAADASQGLLEDASRAEARAIAARTTGYQQETLGILGNVEGTIERTEQTGQDTAVKLQKQGEQLKHIDDELDEMQTDMKRAQRELLAFTRRMATDRLILCCIVLVVLAFGGVIAAKHFISKDAETDTASPSTRSPSHAAPPPPW